MRRPSSVATVTSAEAAAVGGSVYLTARPGTAVTAEATSASGLSVPVCATSTRLMSAWMMASISSRNR